MLSNRVFLIPKMKLAYGCVFCLTGKEALIAHYIENQNPDIRATAVRQTKRHTHRGITTLRDEVVFNGYVLFQAPENTPVYDALPTEEPLSLLTYSGGDWRLYGDDERYAQWVFRNNGLIKLSRAYKLGDRVHIIDGPLKDLEGHITRVDHRNRNGQVTIPFGGKLIKIWLGFDIIEEYATDERALAWLTLYMERSRLIMSKKLVSLLLALALLCACVPATAATYSKTTKDLIRVVSTNAEDGAPLALFIPESGAQGIMEETFNDLAAFVAENNAALDYFGEDVKTAVAALQPQGTDLTKLTLTEFAPFQLVNYEPAMGNVVATFEFATPFTADQPLAVLVGYVGKDGKMVWITLQATVAESGLTITFPAEVLQELPAEIVIAVLA